MRRISFLLTLLMGVWPALAAAELRLLMAEEPGCYWCATWNKEIGGIYPKTAEGRTAPLQRYDILSPPSDVTFSRPVNFTPTFILVQDSEEVSRIEGYPGEDFFWGLLEQILLNTPKYKKEKSAS